MMTTSPGKKSDPAPKVKPPSLYEKLEERAIAEINDLNRRITACRRCPRGEFLPTVGSGHPLADIMLVKYGPRYLEVSEGVAFFGRSGAAVLRSMERLGIDPLLLYGTNFLKCGGLEGPEAEEQCAAYLAEELRIVQPRMLVLMGERTVSAFNAQRPAGMAEVEWLPGEVRDLTAFCKVLVTPDIDASLDEREAKTAFWQAFRALGDWHRDEPPY